MPRGQVTGEIGIVAQSACQPFQRPAQRLVGQLPLGQLTRPATQHLGARQPGARRQAIEQLTVRRVEVDLDRFANTSGAAAGMLHM